MRLWQIAITSELDPNTEEEVIVKVYGLDFVPDDYLETLRKGITEELVSRSIDKRRVEQTDELEAGDAIID